MKENLRIASLEEKIHESEAVFTVSQSDMPLSALVPGTALAMICGSEGPAYRPKGTCMVIGADGTITGHLSSGCIDHDVALHAREVLADGQVRNLRYGRGSPFFDVKLPCGGGLDIMIVPCPDRLAIGRARSDLAARRLARLPVAPGVTLEILPELRFVIFGKGCEARIFSEMVHAAAWRAELFSTDEETLAGCRRFSARPLLNGWPQGVQTDPRTAVTLFFHDHDREIPLLRHALASPGFYIGAMGSQRAADARHDALLDSGVPPAQLKRLRHPFGLIPQARNPRSLAISVLADVLAFSTHP